VFEHYRIEPYDSDKRKKVEQRFLDLPVTIALGAMSFFLLVGKSILKQYSIFTEISEGWRIGD